MSESDEFVIVEAESGMCLDIYESKADYGVRVQLYAHVHRGPNQTFYWKRRKIVSRVDGRNFCLGFDPNSKNVILSGQNDPGTDWKYQDGKIVALIHENDVENDDELLMRAEGIRIFVNSSKNGATKWNLLPVTNEHGAKPATSCHLRFGPVKQLDSSEWVLECTVNVESSARSTYFCVVGWGPAGYSGIQEWGDGGKGAIFSMWNDDEGNKVELIGTPDPEVQVSGFGGEGTGLKSMRTFDWQLREDVRFRVTGYRVGQKSGGYETWRCKCEVEHKRGTFQMATFQRTSKQRPLNLNGFYSFVEDYDRSSGAAGHEITRKAAFANPRLNGIPLTEAKFTKVEWDADSFGKKKAFAGILPQNGYFLSTGGKSIQVTSENDTVLK